MKRYLLFFLPFFFSVSLSAITLNGIAYTIDTLESFPVGPGTQYTSLRLLKEATGDGRLDVFFLAVDTKNPYITFQAVLGQDSILKGERPSAMAARKSTAEKTFFAGTNGDFYITVGDIGRPAGGTMVDAQLAYTPNDNRRVSAIDENKIAHIGIMRYSGTAKCNDTTLTIEHINYNRLENELVLYNQHQGKVTRTNGSGTEVLLQLLENQSWGVNKTIRTKVVKIEKNKGSMAIPEGQAVLSGHGTMQTVLDGLAENDEVVLTLNMTLNDEAVSFTNAIGGDQRVPMLTDGVVESNIDNIWNELHPRTGFGASRNSDTLFFCVVDGRGLSVGCTTKVLAELMQSAGAYNALNWDGGGSSCMYVKEFGPVNKPSDGTERAVSNAFFAVSTAPEDNNIAKIYAYDRVVSVPRYGVVDPKFLGYNQYGTLLSTDVQHVVLSCTSEVGEILSDGRFLASGANGGVVTATYNGNIQTQVQVNLITDAEIAIRLDSVLIDNRAGYEVEVQSIIGINTMDVLPAALTWQVQDESICSAEKGLLLGKQNGSTWVYGTLGSFTDSILVNVEIPTESPYVWDDFTLASNNWNLTCTSGFNAQFASPECVDCPTEIQFTYKSARAPFLKMERVATLYSLPDTICFSLNTNAELSKIIIGLCPNNLPSSSTIGTTFTNIPQNTDVRLAIPVDQLVTIDAAIYPIWVRYITLYLATTNTAGDYSVKLNGLSLCYNGLEITYLQPNRDSRFQVYPNPARDVLHIVNADGVETQMRLFDLQGKQLKTQTLIGADTDINISDLPAGTYLLQVGAESVKVVKK